MSENMRTHIHYAKIPGINVKCHENGCIKASQDIPIADKTPRLSHENAICCSKRTRFSNLHVAFAETFTHICTIAHLSNEYILDEIKRQQNFLTIF